VGQRPVERGQNVAAGRSGEARAGQRAARL
jgi:hypothetical protein